MRRPFYCGPSTHLPSRGPFSVPEGASTPATHGSTPAPVPCDGPLGVGIVQLPPRRFSRLRCRRKRPLAAVLSRALCRTRTGDPFLTIHAFLAICGSGLLGYGADLQDFSDSADWRTCARNCFRGCPRAYVRLGVLSPDQILRGARLRRERQRERSRPGRTAGLRHVQVSPDIGRPPPHRRRGGTKRRSRPHITNHTTTQSSHQAAASTTRAITAAATTRKATRRTASTTAVVVDRAGRGAPRPHGRAGQVVEQPLELAISTRAQGDVQSLLELVGVESPFHGRDAQPLGDCVAVRVGSPQGGMTGHVRFVRYRARLADSRRRATSAASCA